MPSTIDIVGEKVLENINKAEEKLKILAETSVLMDKAEEFVRTGNYRAAIKIYEDVIQEHGAAVEVFEKQAEACVRAGQIEDAISCYKKCVAIEKSNVRACQGLGNCYCQLGMHRNARDYYLKVLEMEPENAFVDHKIGRIYLMENNLKAAERHFEMALKRNPHFYEIYEDLATIKSDQQREDDAANVLSQFIKLYPEDMRGHIKFAETLIKAERYQEAEEAIRQGIQEANKEKYAPPVALYNRWGIALRKQDKFLAAIQKYELALEIEPNNPEIHFNIAKACFESGEKHDIVVKKLSSCFEIDSSLKDEFWEDKLLTPLHKYFPKPVQKN
jgi:tetratricopeptide (TPR) repeat protein